MAAPMLGTDVAQTVELHLRPPGSDEPGTPSQFVPESLGIAETISTDGHALEARRRTHRLIPRPAAITVAGGRLRVALLSPEAGDLRRVSFELVDVGRVLDDIAALQPTV